jgi:hypothetical protein
MKAVRNMLTWRSQARPVPLLVADKSRDKSWDPEPRQQKQASLCLLLPTLDPLLQKVFIVAVSPGTQGKHARVGEEATVCVDEHRH